MTGLLLPATVCRLQRPTVVTSRQGRTDQAITPCYSVAAAAAAAICQVTSASLQLARHAPGGCPKFSWLPPGRSPTRLRFEPPLAPIFCLQLVIEDSSSIRNWSGPKLLAIQPICTHADAAAGLASHCFQQLGSTPTWHDAIIASSGRDIMY